MPTFRESDAYGISSTVIAAGSVVLPFALGAAVTVLFGFAPSLLSPIALFVGAIMTATSVGITARVLSALRRLDTPEGVTVLAGAVIDDVLGILVLSIVVGMAASGEVSLADLGLVGGKAAGFWLLLTGVGILLSSQISRLLSGLRSWFIRQVCARNGRRLEVAPGITKSAGAD